MAGNWVEGGGRMKATLFALVTKHHDFHPLISCFVYCYNILSHFMVSFKLDQRCLIRFSV